MYEWEVFNAITFALFGLIFRPSRSVLLVISTCQLASGCAMEVMDFSIRNSSHHDLNRSLVNCFSLSEIICFGMPNLHTMCF